MSEGVREETPAPPCVDSLVENREVEVPAQAADDPVIGHAHGKVVIVVLGEGDGVGVGTRVAFLQEELQGDVELALAVLHDGQIRQVGLEQPVQGLQLVGVQQAIVDGPGARGEHQERERSLNGARGDSEEGVLVPVGSGMALEGAGGTDSTSSLQRT